MLLNFFNLYGTALFEQLINIPRFIEMWMRVSVKASVCASFNQVESHYINIAIHYFILRSIIYIPFTIVYYVIIRGMCPI